MQPDDWFLDEHQVCKRLNVGRATLSQLVKAREFPSPDRKGRKGEGCKAWKRSAVNRWFATYASREMRRA